MSKIREKESLECVRMHIWASKTQKLPGPLSGPWTLAAECSLHSCDSASLCRQLSASEAGPPPLDQILDPHLENVSLFNNSALLWWKGLMLFTDDSVIVCLCVSVTFTCLSINRSYSCLFYYLSDRRISSVSHVQYHKVCEHGIGVGTSDTSKYQSIWS